MALLLPHRAMNRTEDIRDNDFVVMTSNYLMMVDFGDRNSPNLQRNSLDTSETTAGSKNVDHQKKDSVDRRRHSDSQQHGMNGKAPRRTSRSTTKKVRKSMVELAPKEGLPESKSKTKQTKPASTEEGGRHRCHQADMGPSPRRQVVRRRSDSRKLPMTSEAEATTAVPIQNVSGRSSAGSSGTSLTPGSNCRSFSAPDLHTQPEKANNQQAWEEANWSVMFPARVGHKNKKTSSNNTNNNNFIWNAEANRNSLSDQLDFVDSAFLSTTIDDPDDWEKFSSLGKAGGIEQFFFLGKSNKGNDFSSRPNNSQSSPDFEKVEFDAPSFEPTDSQTSSSSERYNVKKCKVVANVAALTKKEIQRSPWDPEDQGRGTESGTDYWREYNGGSDSRERDISSVHLRLDNARLPTLRQMIMARHNKAKALEELRISSTSEQVEVLPTRHRQQLPTRRSFNNNPSNNPSKPAARPPTPPRPRQRLPMSPRKQQQDRGLSATAAATAQRKPSASTFSNLAFLDDDNDTAVSTEVPSRDKRIDEISFSDLITWKRF